MNKIDINKIIETKRLIIRYVNIKDQPPLFNQIFNSDKVLEYFIAEKCENIEDLKLDKMIDVSIKSNRYFMSIELKENNEVIGLILECDTPDKYFNNVELGYAIGEKYWNQGYATEALQAMIDFEFKENNVHKIVCSHIEENTRSKRVMEKCNMIYEGKFIEELYYHNHYYNLCYYYLINKNI